jgi:hypothetical protein
MVRQSIQSQINDAVRTAVDDIAPDLVRNWCKHIRIRQENVSPLGQMIGLPIGLKAVDCPYFPGYAAMMVSQVAPRFIEDHCLACPHHQEVHSNNIGRQIVDRVAARKEQEARIAAAREELERLRPDDPSACWQRTPIPTKP